MAKLIDIIVNDPKFTFWAAATAVAQTEDKHIRAITIDCKDINEGFPIHHYHEGVLAEDWETAIISKQAFAKAIGVKLGNYKGALISKVAAEKYNHKIDMLKQPPFIK
jgi:hypothetical protein